MELERFSALIEALYDAALDPAGWPRLAPSLARAVGAESCALQIRDLGSEAPALLGVTENYDAKVMEDYCAHYHKLDLWVSGAARLGIGRTMLGQEAVDDSTFLASEFYNDWVRRLSIFHIVGSTMAVEADRIGVVGICRPQNGGAFDDGDIRVLGLLVPHLSRAMQLHGRLEGLRRDRRLALEAVEALAVGVMAVGADGRLLFANAKAERCLRAGRGLTVRDGRLCARDGARHEQLSRLVRQAALAAIGLSAGAGGVLALPREDGSLLSLLVSPLRPKAMPAGPLQPVALIFIGDPDDKRTTPRQALADLYGLTPAEARLAEALLGGETVAEYAERAGVSANTAKTQLKRVFAKTGCGRQAELVAAILDNPVLRAARAG